MGSDDVYLKDAIEIYHEKSRNLKCEDVDSPALNNAEFTFIRNDRIEKKKVQNNFPHKMDFDFDLIFKPLALLK